jgi:hypothetical protein
MAERSSEEAYLNSGRFAALGTPFEVLVHERVHGVLAEPLGWAFEGLRSPRSSEGGEPPRLTYRLSEAAPGASMIRIERNNETVRDRILPSQALNAMMTDINAAAISAVGDRLAIHGGAVSYGDIGILLAGESGSGKSTLTAAMVAEGCDYLTDEAVVIDWADLKMNPYAKPLSLSAQSRLALGCAPVEPRAGDLVPASHLRADSWGGPVRARLLLFPQFVEGSRPKLTRLTRAQAVVELAQNSFNFVDHGGEWLPFLRDVVAGCTSWSLVTGDARRAARMIVEAVGRRASRT